MSSKICKAILDLDPKDHDGINNQGRRFLDFLYTETTLYATPPIVKLDFQGLVETSETMTSKAIEGSKLDRTNRDEASSKLLNAMSLKLIPYINGLYAGNRSELERSGAKTSVDPSPVPLPDDPNISRIEKGPVANSVKIYLVRNVNPELKKRSTTEYRIYMFPMEDSPECIEIGSSFNSNKLIGYNVPYNEFRYFAVRAFNRGGASMFSSKVRFFLTN